LKLLQEVCEQVQVLNEESSEGKKSTYIVGPFIATECLNKNGRWYKREIVEKEVARYTNEYIKTNRALGEMHHATTPALSYERASHLIKELRQDGNNFIGKAKILESLPMGKLAKGLIDEGITIGVSTRGLGSLSEDAKLKAKVVGDDFRLCSVDLVTDPSGPGCFVQGLVENAEWVWDSASDSYIERGLDEMKKTIKSAPKSRLNETKIRAFDKFFRLLKEKVVS
jgi:hypothetical protein